jgi:hypothetical protein
MITGVADPNHGIVRESLAKKYQRWADQKVGSLGRRIKSCTPSTEQQFRGDLFRLVVGTLSKVVGGVAALALGSLEVTVISGGSLMVSTYRRLWTRSIEQSQYETEIGEAFEVFCWGWVKGIVHPLRMAYKTVYGGAALPGLVVCHLADKCDRHFGAHRLYNRFPDQFTSRESLYRGTGSVVVALFLCATPFHIIGFWVLWRSLLFALLSFIYRRSNRVDNSLGLVEAVNHSLIDNRLLQALLTGCCTEERIHRLVGGLICFLGAGLGPLPIYWTLLCMVLLGIGEMILRYLHASAGNQEEANSWLTQPKSLEFLNYSLLFLLSSLMSGGTTLFELFIYAIACILVAFFLKRAATGDVHQ